MFYKPSFKIDDKEELQKQLNQLYYYNDDLNTKVLHRNRINLFFMLMHKLLERNVIKSFDSAIDIGCNAGIYSRIISDFGFKKVLGIDIESEMIEKANGLFAYDNNGKVIEYKVLDAKDMDSKKKFDFILCTEVIEHVENPEKLIEKIKVILAPEGVAIISLPNVLSIPYIMAILFYKLTNKRFSEDLSQHIRYPFYKTIKIFKEEKFRIIETTGTNLFFNRILVKIFYKTPFFSLINRLNFNLSKLWPLKYFTQFFFIVIKNHKVLDTVDVL